MSKEKTKDYRWDLSVLYEGIEDPAFEADRQKLKETAEKSKALVQKLNEDFSEELLPSVIAFTEEAQTLASRLGLFLSLSRSADTKNPAYTALLNQISLEMTPLGVLNVAAGERIAALPDPDAFIEDYHLEEYRYLLHKIKEQAGYRLSQELEALASKLSLSGGSAWADMASYLTSTLEAELDGKCLGLSAVRNLASDPDPELRKKAYEAELKAYPKIEDAMAYALHSIKSQVSLMARERGYASPLDEALKASRLEKESLDSMLEVMEESLPLFRRYFKAKAQILGHEEQLPFYDLFAPVGQAKSDYSIEEAQDFLLDVFSDLSEDIAGVMKRAFDEDWIDYLPRQGKVGGAFCANMPALGQSRVLTNFDGSFSAVDTLAHELGHAYHGYCIEDHRILNRSYSMPVAETASTFNETHLTLRAAEKSKSPEEELAVLEQFISSAAQTIVDILSRYLFEKEVFARCETEFLDSRAMQDIMLRAQKATYGDAMPDDLRHPYMWICKSHYYSTGLSYYNFPYAFGQLFSLALYGMYQEEGPAFMKKYKKLLHATTVSDCEELAAMAGADIRSKAFWRQGISTIEDLIERYCELASGM